MKNNFKNFLCAFMLVVSMAFMMSVASAKTCFFAARIKAMPTAGYKDVCELMGKQCLLRIYKFNTDKEYEEIRATAWAGFLKVILYNNKKEYFIIFSYEDDDVSECFKYDFLKKLASDKDRGDSFGILDEFRYGCHLVGSAEFEGDPVMFDGYLDINLRWFLHCIEVDDFWKILDFFRFSHQKLIFF